MASSILTAAEEVGLRLLELALQEAPHIVDTLARVSAGLPDDSPLAERVRELLPDEGAATRARRALEGDDRPG